ncbi:quaternary ammonium compound efflux SMR transporter SugE [Sphingomonas sp. BK069]|uniref:quaternary ammonium compound efflux SMR transporter SugE n=1 Tax=Sphingomonas sp. BK069 TaxID=2586979 RepID=UPI001609FEE3|nr:quaternary ammonium compound efflux SMR transporter SugE [Sphingomonas sp. BK069]MBB3348301.1 quaternary ammonium compound-resistance protein SugE [Sphingomonas sp. BK069]
MAWVVLVVGGLFEVVWAFAMKQSHGFTRIVPSTIAVAGVVLSLALLSWSMRSLPLGTAYMVWTGIGAVGAFAVGILVLGEPANAMRLIAALLILSGLVMMKLATP